MAYDKPASLTVGVWLVGPAVEGGPWDVGQLSSVPFFLLLPVEPYGVRGQAAIGWRGWHTTRLLKLTQ